MRASPEQFSALIEFMERHGDLSKPHSGAQGRLRSDRLWQNLTNVLNSIDGGVANSPDKWRKVWVDWKSETKEKYMTIRRHASGTDGDPSNRQILTAVEDRVVGISGMYAVVGQGGLEEQGFNSPSSSNVDEIVNTNDDPPIQFPPATTPSPPLPPLPPPPPPPPSFQPTSDSQPSLPPLSPSVSPRPQATQRTPLRSPRSTNTTPRRLQARTRRNRGLTPFDRATSEFVAVEQRRLKLEERRERDLHERETERLRLENERLRLENKRLRLESQRIEVTREKNRLLQQLDVIAQTWLDILKQQTRIRLPSTETLPDSN